MGSTGTNTNFGDSTKNAGVKLGQGILATVGATGDVLSSASKMVSSASNTTADLVEVSGKSLTSAVSIVSNVVQTVESLSARLADVTKESQIQAKSAYKVATTKSLAADDVQKKQIELDRIKEMEKIELKFQRDKADIEGEQKLLLDQITAVQQQTYLNTAENKRKLGLAHYFGFKTKKPGVSDTGYQNKMFGFSNWCESYLPNTFVKTGNEGNNEGNIDIIFPETLPDGIRQEKMKAIDGAGQEIEIFFRSKQIPYRFRKGWETVNSLVIRYPGDNRVIDGTMYFRQIVFLCPKTTGGRKRRTNKRKTNRRRTNRRR